MNLYYIVCYTIYSVIYHKHRISYCIIYKSINLLFDIYT